MIDTREELYESFPAETRLTVYRRCPVFATQKVCIKFKSIMSFCLDFLRNWDSYGTLIWESMSSGRQKKLVKLAGPEVSTWGQKIH